MRRLVTVVATLAVLAGCSTSASDLPLPGSRVGGSTYRIDAVFDDALNLAIGAPVKLDGVTIGRVRSVRPANFTAEVALDLKTATRLREGATARLRATTPLGELFVDVDDPDSGSLLADGARLARADTSAAPTIEDTMASASMVLNGGGLGQLQTIVREANNALEGRETSARSLLGRLDTTARALNESSDDIDATLDALADVSDVLRDRQETINDALVEISPAARELRKNTDELVELLRSIEDFGDSTTDLVKDSRADLLRILRQLSPVLDELNSLDGDLGPGIDQLVDFAGRLDEGVPTDYLNTYLYFQDELNLALPGLDVTLKPPEQPGPSDPESPLGSGPIVIPGLTGPTETGEPGLIDRLLRFGGAP